MLNLLNLLEPWRGIYELGEGRGVGARARGNRRFHRNQQHHQTILKAFPRRAAQSIPISLLPSPIQTPKARRSPVSHLTQSHVIERASGIKFLEMVLHLLHHKSYHPYKADNVARVQRDEAKARAEEEELDRRTTLAVSRCFHD